MRTYIKKLQSKSEGTRKQILVGSMIVSMFFVGLIWVNGFSTKISKTKSVETDDAIKPFSLFGKTISDTYGNVSASVGNITKIKQEVVDAVKVENQKQIDLIPVELQSQ